MSAPMFRVTLPLPLMPLASNKSRNCSSNPPPRDAVKPPKKTSPRSQVSTWVKSPFISEDSKLIFSWSFQQFPQKNWGGNWWLESKGPSFLWMFFLPKLSQISKNSLSKKSPTARSSSTWSTSNLIQNALPPFSGFRVPWISLGFNSSPQEKFWIPGSFRANSRKVLGGGRFQINFREGWQDVKKKKPIQQTPKPKKTCSSATCLTTTVAKLKTWCLIQLRASCAICDPKMLNPNLWWDDAANASPIKNNQTPATQESQ